MHATKNVSGDEDKPCRIRAIASFLAHTKCADIEEILLKTTEEARMAALDILNDRDPRFDSPRFASTPPGRSVAYDPKKLILEGFVSGEGAEYFLAHYRHVLRDIPMMDDCFKPGHSIPPSSSAFVSAPILPILPARSPGIGKIVLTSGTPEDVAATLCSKSKCLVPQSSQPALKKPRRYTAKPSSKLPGPPSGNRFIEANTGFVKGTLRTFLIEWEEKLRALCPKKSKDDIYLPIALLDGVPADMQHENVESVYNYVKHENSQVEIVPIPADGLFNCMTEVDDVYQSWNVKKSRTWTDAYNGCVNRVPPVELLCMKVCYDLRNFKVYL